MGFLLAVHAASGADAVLGRVRKLLAVYRLHEAMAALGPYLQAHPSDADALMLAGQIAEAAGDPRTAQTRYQSAVEQASTSAEAHSRLARALLAQNRLPEAAEQLRVALTATPAEALTLATAALYHLRRGRYDLSQQYADRALAVDPASKEAALVAADLACNRDDLAGARRTLERLLHDNPADPDGLYMMGVVLFNQRDFQEAQSYLERSSTINTFAAGILRDLAQVLVQNGQLERALATLDRLLERFPDDAPGRSLRSSLTERLELTRHGVQTQVGVFHVVHSPDLPSKILDGIVSSFRTACDAICPRLGYSPKNVNVWIFEQTQNQLPAFYNHLSDEIIVSRKYFERMDEPEQRRIGLHLVLHEFTHLVAYQRLGQPAFTPRALWLMEGLAELMAGGYDYSDVGVSSIFADGLLDFSQLAEHLPVSAAETGPSRVKAYVQSYLMVDWLFKQPEPFPRFARMISDYTRGATDAEVVANTLRLTPEAFLGQVASHIGSMEQPVVRKAAGPG